MHSKHDNVQIMPQNISISHPHDFVYWPEQMFKTAMKSAYPSFWWRKFKSSAHCMEQFVLHMLYLNRQSRNRSMVTQKQCPLWPGHSMCSVPFLNGHLDKADPRTVTRTRCTLYVLEHFLADWVGFQRHCGMNWGTVNYIWNLKSKNDRMKEKWEK